MGSLLLYSKTQIVAYAVLSAIFLGTLIAIDTIASMEYYYFVPETNVDVLIIIKPLSGYTSQDEENIITSINELLNSKEYINGYIEAIALQISIGIPSYKIDNYTFLYNGYILGLDAKDFKFLNLSDISDDKIYLRQDIAYSFGLSKNSIITCNYSGVQINITVTDMFHDYELMKQANIIALAPANLLREIVNQTSEELAFFYDRIFIIDINSTKVDYVNYHLSAFELTIFERDLMLIYQKYGKNVACIDVIFGFKEKFNNYVYWRSKIFDKSYLLALLPILLAFLGFQYFFIETFLAKTGHRIKMLILRGYPRFIESKIIFSSLLMLSFLGTIIGMPLGCLYGIFLVSLLTNTSKPVLSYLSIIYTLLYCLLVMLFGIAIYMVKESYRDFIKYIMRAKTGIQRKLALLFGGTYLDILLIIYSILVILWVTSGQANADLITIAFYEMLSIFIFFIVIYLFAPFAFIIGVTILLFGIASLLAHDLTSKLKSKLNAYLFLIAIRNVLRRDVKSKVFAVILSIVFATSTASSLILESYEPYIIATEKWYTGSDIGIYFKFEGNITEAYEMQEKIINRIGRENILSSTIIFVAYNKIEERRQLDSNYYEIIERDYYILGIDPNTFLNTAYSIYGKLFCESKAFANTIKKMRVHDSFAVASKDFSEQFHISNGSILRFFDDENEEIIGMEIIDVTDEPISYMFASSVFIRHNNTIFMDELPSMELKSYIFNQISEYLIVNYNTFFRMSNLISKESIAAIILIKLKDEMKNEAHLNRIKSILKLMSENHELRKCYIRITNLIVARIFEEKYMILEILKRVYWFLLFLIAISMFEYSSVLKEKRAREFIILVAIGESSKRIAKMLFYEILITLSYSMIIGLLAGFPLYILLAPSQEISYRFAIDFLWSLEWIQSIVITIAFLFTLSLVFGSVSLFRILKKEALAHYLKIEWAVSEF